MLDTTTKKKTFAEALAPTILESAASHKRPITRYKGMPSISFTPEEVDRYSLPFKYTLIATFWHGRPNMKKLSSCMERIGFKTNPKFGPLDDQHIILTFAHPEDYQRCFLHRLWSASGYTMRVTKWTLDFDPKVDKPIVPIWISIRGLPLYLQNKSALWNIAHMIGFPWKMDSATSNGLRPSVVRLCLKVDISKALPTRLHIQSGDQDLYPTVEYENVPLFCTSCRTLGHETKQCSTDSACAQEKDKVAPLENKKIIEKPKR